MIWIKSMEMEIDSTGEEYIEFLTKVKRRVVSARILATRAINRDLTGLIKLDILEQTGKGRGIRYVFKKKWFAGNLSKICRRF